MHTWLTRCCTVHSAGHHQQQCNSNRRLHHVIRPRLIPNLTARRVRITRLFKDEMIAPRPKNMQGLFNDTHAAHVCAGEVNNQGRPKIIYTQGLLYLQCHAGGEADPENARSSWKMTGTFAGHAALPTHISLQGVFQPDQLSQVEVATAACLHLSFLFASAFVPFGAA
jgi:hypothetical protein